MNIICFATIKLLHLFYHELKFYYPWYIGGLCLSLDYNLYHLMLPDHEAWTTPLQSRWAPPVGWAWGVAAECVVVISSSSSSSTCMHSFCYAYVYSILPGIGVGPEGPFHTIIFRSWISLLFNLVLLQTCIFSILHFCKHAVCQQCTLINLYFWQPKPNQLRFSKNERTGVQSPHRYTYAWLNNMHV